MQNQKHYTVYITTNFRQNVLYVGSSSDLTGRIDKHRKKFYPKSFSARYNVDRLVYYCEFPTAQEMVDFEQKLKAGSRRKKEALVDEMNPQWLDLAARWFDECGE